MAEVRTAAAAVGATTGWRLIPRWSIKALALEAVVLILLRLVSPADATYAAAEFSGPKVLLLLVLIATHCWIVARSIEVGIISLTFVTLTPAFALIPESTVTSPAVLLLAITLLGVVYHRPRSTMDRAALILVAFVAWTVLGHMRAGAEETGGDIGGPATLFAVLAPNEDLTALLSGVVNALLIVFFARSRWFPYVLAGAILTAAGIMSLYGLYDYLVAPSQIDTGDAAEAVRRAEAVGVGTNMLGILSAALIPLAAAAIASRAATARRLGFVVTALLLTGVLVSGSRMAFALAILMMALLLPRLRALSPGLRYVVISAALLGVIVAVTQEATAVKRLEETSQDETVELRRISAETAWRAANEQPLFGIGVSRFYEYNRVHGVGYELATHNWHLQVVATTGFGGLILSSWFLVAVLLRSRRRLADPDAERLLRGAGLTVVAMILGGMTIELMLTRNVYIVAALILVAHRGAPSVQPAGATQVGTVRTT